MSVGWYFLWATLFSRPVAEQVQMPLIGVDESFLCASLIDVF